LSSASSSATKSAATSASASASVTTSTSASVSASASVTTSTSASATPTTISGYSSYDYYNALSALQNNFYANASATKGVVPVNSAAELGKVSINVDGVKYSGVLTLPIPPAALSQDFIERMMYNSSTVRKWEDKHLAQLADIASAIRNGTYIAGPGDAAECKPGVPGKGTGTSAFGGLFAPYPPQNKTAVLSNYTAATYDFQATDAGSSVSALVTSGASKVAVVGSALAIGAISAFMAML